uniref:Uncharacterized protein n=1 Tax=Emiliania huxleyi TaxID=2903 RepID=A0A7S3SN26_EMIHU
MIHRRSTSTHWPSSPQATTTTTATTTTHTHTPPPPPRPPSHSFEYPTWHLAQPHNTCHHHSPFARRIDSSTHRPSTQARVPDLDASSVRTLGLLDHEETVSCCLDDSVGWH